MLPLHRCNSLRPRACALPAALLIRLPLFSFLTRPMCSTSRSRPITRCYCAGRTICFWGMESSLHRSSVARWNAPTVRHNSTAISALCASLTSHCSFLMLPCFCFAETVFFLIADTILTTLHAILQLHEQAQGATVRIVLFPIRSLELTAQHIIRGCPPTTASSPPLFTQLHISSRLSSVHVAYCSLWKHVAATPNVRVFWLPALDTQFGAVGPSDQQRLVVSRLLSYWPRAQLFPPLSWDDLFEHKNRAYKRFGSDYMLETSWYPLQSIEQVPAVAAAILNGRSDGQYMLKGSSSWGGLAVKQFPVQGGKSIGLPALLRDLFAKQHQRCFGVQACEASLFRFEQRVYLVQDSTCVAAGGWRQVVSVHSYQTVDGAMHVELQQPTHGNSLKIAGFIDKLLAAHVNTFKYAADLGIPLLRLDCGIRGFDERCFLNELAACDPTLFSEVHSQDLAFVSARGYVQQMILLSRQ
jgi:hypothetical protein